MDDFESEYGRDEDNDEYLCHMLGSFDEDLRSENKHVEASSRRSPSLLCTDSGSATGPEPTYQHCEEDKGPESWKRPPVSIIDPYNDSIRNSVCAFVHEFEPYFYIKCPENFTQSHFPEFKRQLESQLRTMQKDTRHVIKDMQLVEKMDIWHYQFEENEVFIKITVGLPHTVSACKSTLEQHDVLVNDVLIKKCKTYETNVMFQLRFMIDCEISGGTWIELKPMKYKLIQDGQKLSMAQIEVKVQYENIINHPAEGEYARLAPFRIMSVDIECAGRKGQFPDPQYDSVIQIASRVTCLGQDIPKINNILTLKECSAIAGAEVMSFDEETNLLIKWQKLLRISDPDIIIGYNICNFDLPYLVNRARQLNIERAFEFWGRIHSSRLKMRDSQFSSKAYGTHEYKEITIEGRVQFDLLLTIQRDHKLSSYSLNSVSAHFLGEQKEDVHHSCINDLQNGNPETRRRLAVYCLKDAYLPQRLIDRLMYMYNYIEMARVTGVPFSFLLTKGQSIKVYSQLLRKARKEGFVIPTHQPQGQSQGVAFEGATVLDAQQGYYSTPVATLDFASLYPSIMMAYNLCYTTYVPNESLSRITNKSEQCEISPCNKAFVKPCTRKGLLPAILEELLSARKRAKEDLKRATDLFQKAVLDGRQLALKVSANSVYGFTGATVGKLPCLEISSSVTAYGREMIMKTKDFVRTQYNKKNGYEEDCEVIYGDTDSVMVNFKAKSIARSMELGKHAAEWISKKFPSPVKLEFEKVYCPYLLMSKKRYAGLLWTQPDKHDKMDTKGIESVRRDNCLLVRKMVNTSLEKLLIEQDISGALEYVKETISDLLMNRLDLSELVVSKGLSRDASEYGTRLAHVELAKKMQKRDPATAPGIGDRVPYVIIKASKGAKAYEKAEDPIYALENSLPIDFQHYVDHHLAQPLTRIFEPILKSRVNELLHGKHTRNLIVSTPSAASGGIMRFAKKTERCVGCKAPLDKGYTTLCLHCEPSKAEIYLKNLQSVNDLEDAFGRLWTQCQTCQGSLLQDVLCTNRDCPIFYRRKKVQKDLGDAQLVLNRLNE
eukprot:g40.t1